jgi:hypothetical protein
MKEKGGGVGTDQGDPVRPQQPVAEARLSLPE